MGDKLTKNLAGLNDSIKQYLQARIDLFKLTMLKKATNSLGFIFGLLIIILMSTLFVAFAGAAFVIWYGITFNNYLEGALIFSGFLMFVLIMFILFRKKILTSVFLYNISNILFEEDEDEN